MLGRDVVREAAVRRLVSLTGQFASVDADLTAEENLVLLARLLGYADAGLGSALANCWRRSASPALRGIRPAGCLAACTASWTSGPASSSAAAAAAALVAVFAPLAALLYQRE